MWYFEAGLMIVFIRSLCFTISPSLREICADSTLAVILSTIHITWSILSQTWREFQKFNQHRKVSFNFVNRIVAREINTFIGGK